MLAYEWLYHSKLDKTPVGPGEVIADYCNGDYMLEMAEAYREGKVEGPLGTAYGYATNQIDQMDVYAYDVTDEYGGLDTLLDLERCFIKFKMQTPGKKRIVVVDFAQLVESGGTDEKTLYSNMRAFSRAIPLYAQRHQCTVIALSQQNDEYKKGGDSTKTTGAKGGGDLPAAVTSFIETGYDADEPDQMTAKRTRARRGAAAGKKKMHGMFQTFIMHAASGLITGTLPNKVGK